MSELTAKENIKTADTVKRITATAVMAALTTLMTAYIFHIPVGVNGGYVHLGDTMIYLAAAFLPLPYACAAGAIGGGLADSSDSTCMGACNHNYQNADLSSVFF